MLKLTLVPNMWTHEGGELTPGEPIRFEVVGLPSGEVAEVSQAMRHGLWELNYTSKAGDVFVTKCTSPEAALEVLWDQLTH